MCLVGSTVSALSANHALSNKMFSFYTVEHETKTNVLHNQWQIEYRVLRLVPVADWLRLRLDRLQGRYSSQWVVVKI